MQTTKQPIVIKIAMQDEAKYLIQHFNFKALPAAAEKSADFPLHVYKAHFNQQELILVIPEAHPIHQVDSIGTQMAAITTWEAIRRFSPWLIINTGTAGGIGKQGARVGDIYLVQQPVYYHDRLIPIGNFEPYGYGGFKPHQIKIAEGIFKDGVLASGNSFITPEQENRLLEKFKVSLVDMEAAAIGEVATRLGIPFVPLKIISDLADQPHTSAEFESRIGHIGEQLPLAVEKVLASL